MQIFRMGDAHTQELSGCHGGTGEYSVTTLVKDPSCSALKYVRDLTLAPGSTIGLHQHDIDEELYYVLSGNGVVEDENHREKPVAEGTLVLTQKRGSHGLRNTGRAPMRILVICVRPPS
jgi:quercetin dioxygenase-like cupin family protein